MNTFISRTQKSGAGAAIALGVTAAMVTTLAFAPAAHAHPPTDAEVPTSSVSAGHGHGLDTSLLGMNLAGAASVSSHYPDQMEPLNQPLNAALLQGLVAFEGTPIEVPLLKQPGDPNSAGLLHLGSLGAISSFANSPRKTLSEASSGLIESDGSLDLDADAASGFEPAKLDLSALLEQLLGATVTDTVLDTAQIEIGALGAYAQKNRASVSDEYMLTALRLDLHSNLVGDLSDELTATVNAVVAPVNGVVGEGGIVTGVVGELSGLLNLDLTDPLTGTGVKVAPLASGNAIAVTGLDALVNSIVADLLDEEVSNADQSVLVDLGTGTIRVDLAELVVKAQNDPLIQHLNQLPANTSVLTEDVVEAITNGVSEALIGDSSNSLATKLHDLLDQRIWNEVGIEIKLGASAELCVTSLICNPVAGTGVTVTGTLAEFTGKNGESLNGSDNIDIDLELLGADLGGLLNAIAGPILGVISDDVTGPLLDLVTNDVLGDLQQTVQSSALSGVVGQLVGALEPVLDDLVRLRINEQPTATPLNETGGDLGAGSFTVRALAIEVLSVANGVVRLDFGSASVKASANGPSVAVSPNPAQPGDEITVTGEDFEPGEEVNVDTPWDVCDRTGIVVDGDGGFQYTCTIPGDATPGPHDIVVTDENDDPVADTELEIITVTLTATPTAPQGGTVALTGTGFVAEEEVTITLPSGSPVTVDADASGEISYSWTVPGSHPLGTAAFAAEGESGRHASATSTITAGDPVYDQTDITVSPNAGLAGDPVTVTGTGFAPGETVTITGLDCTSAITANGEGEFTANCTIPAGAAPGPLTVTATGAVSAHPATDTVTVNAPPVVYDPSITVSPKSAVPGASITVTGSGFAPNESVTIAGLSCTGTITASGTGTLNRACTLPSSATPGPRTVTATGAVSAEPASDTLTVIAPPVYNPKITVSPTSAKPGDTVTVKGTGFAPSENVTLTGLASCTPSSFKASGTGTFTVTCKVPANAAAPGTIQVKARGDVSKKDATASLSVTKPPVVYNPKITVSPTSAEPGDRATVKGTGFAPGETVKITGLASCTPSPLKANGSGAFTATCKVAANAAPGTIQVKARGDVSKKDATASLTVKKATVYNPTITVTPNPANPGDKVTVTGKGFKPGEEVDVKGPGDCTRTVKADSKGGFVFTCTIPRDQPAGEVKITGKGKDSGKPVSTTLKVETKWKRLGGPTRFETAVAISKEHFPNGADTVVIARNDIAADALAASPFAVQKGAAVLLTQTASLNPVTERELKRLDPKRVYIAGETGAVSRGVENAVKRMGFEVTRLGGKDRYETANKIAQAGWGKTGADSVFIATGRDFPDALSAGAAAGSIDVPVMLVDGLGSTVRGDVDKQLRTLKPKNIYIAGGTGVVTSQLEKRLSSVAKVQRFAGGDRYATSAAIAKKWNTVGGKVYLATGLDFADALAGSAVAGASGSPIMLSRLNCIPAPVHSVIHQTVHPSMGYVLGGTGVISDRVLNQRPSCG